MKTIQIRVSKHLKEYITQKSNETGLTQAKIVELKFKDELPFINFNKLQKVKK